MEVTIKDTYISVRRTTGPRLKTESAFYYALKKALIAQGHDVVKKNPQKDGHLTSAPYYIRERSGKWCAIDDQYALRLIHLEYNRRQPVTLIIHREKD
jgi:hypothetical protein